MTLWAWVQPVDRIWKIVSDIEKGTLCVYDEKNELVLEHKGIKKEELSFIEQNFLQIVATNLSENKANQFQVIEEKRQVVEHNYMYA